MDMNIKLWHALLATVLLTGVTASAAIYSPYNSGTLNTAIPDGNPSGIQSAITVSGFGGVVSDVNVFLNVSGGLNGDLYAYLSFGGNSVVLLNRIGKTSGNPWGSSTAGFGDGSQTYNNGGTWYSFKLDDAASTDIHGYSGGSPIIGSYQPDRRTADPQLVVDTDARGSSLASYNNLNPNGDWTIFFADMAGGAGTSTLVGWGLEIEAVPEPVNVALGVFAGIAVLVPLCRHGLRKCLPITR